MIGDKVCAEAADCIAMVGERSCQRRSLPGKAGGAATSEYVGLSNDKRSENLRRRKPKGSWGREIRPG